MTPRKNPGKAQGKAPGRPKAPGGSLAHGKSHYRELVGWSLPTFAFPPMPLPSVEIPAETMAGLRESMAAAVAAAASLEETLTKKLQEAKDPETQAILKKTIRTLRRFPGGKS